MKTRDEAEAAMAIIATLTVQLEGELNQQNARLLVAHQNDGLIEELRQRLARYTQGLERWALDHKEAFGPSQKLELRQGFVRWTKGQRAVALLKGWTEELVIVRLKNLKVFARAGCVRVKEEIDRRRLLEGSKPGPGLLFDETDLERAGLAVVQPEKVYIEPKLEGLRAL